MLGWSVMVRALSPEECTRSGSDSAFLLARWDARVDGLGFLDALVRQGKARKLLSGGYPERYVAKAADFLPLIANRPPGTLGPRTEVLRYDDRIAACAAEQLLTIDAWDLS